MNRNIISDQDFMNDEGWINMDIVKGRARKVCFILMITSSFGYLFDVFFTLWREGYCHRNVCASVRLHDNASISHEIFTKLSKIVHICVRTNPI